MIMYQLQYKEGHFSGPFFQLDPRYSQDYSKHGTKLIETDMTDIHAARELADLRSRAQQLQVILNISSVDLNLARTQRDSNIKTIDSLASELRELRETIRFNNQITILDELDRIIDEYGFDEGEEF
jgi:hypothetical protein